ncbi:putative glutathione S-transferase parC [Acorus gramineus]|uniref:Glutathione S-transferase n=1 Tax=Acorus gramineus TaxID=55184 RepID=A0AAV9BV45_ACOGR|nr:putative glutathione S-transferase parC [Acorus gramineus]
MSLTLYMYIQIYVCGQKIVKTKGEDKQKAKEEMIFNMKLLETTLGNEPFFGGEAFGYLNISLISFGSWFHAFEFEDGFSIMDACPKILEWVNRCKERKSVSGALPDPKATIEYAGVLKKRIGIE